MRFSIVVPVYNIEKYIRQCVNSVLCQDFTDYELILVDDGSTDNSGKICDEYAKADCRIRVVHKPNGGLSMARNDGINKAEGMFIIFLDGDDYWNNNRLLADVDRHIHLMDTDVVAFGAQSLFESENGSRLNNQNMNVLISKTRGYSADDFIKVHLTENPLYEWYAIGYAFRRSLFADEKLRFPDNRKFEDVYLTWRLLIRAKRIAVIPTKYYVYRRGREGAITSKFTYSSLQDFLWVVHDNIKTINGMDTDTATRKGANAGIGADVRRLLLDNFAKSYFACCIASTTLKPDERRSYVKELKEKGYIMNYAVDAKYVRITKISKIIGFNGMITVFGLRRSLKEKMKKWRKR